MDEILLANFMVFDDVVRETDYDLWIGDEAWSSITACTRTPSSSARHTPGGPTSSGGCRCPSAAIGRRMSPPTATPR
jgi:hypothetical protein